jgi:hypothetical protein
VNPEHGPAAPPITPDMRAQATTKPGGWLYVVDPAYDGEQDVPPQAVIGGYPVGPDGDVIPDFQANPGYLPTPAALGLTPPASELEATLQLVATGYGDQRELRAALRAAEVITPARSAEDTTVAVFTDHEGRSVVPVFSSESRLPQDGTGWRRVLLAELLPALAGKHVAVDPGTGVSVTVPVELLAD